MKEVDCGNRIIIEAAKLFSAFGIRAVTMDMLAVNLGMSKRTIYENFCEKDELLIAVLNCMVIKRRNLIEKVLGETPDAITAIFRLTELMGDHLRGVNPIFFEDMKRFHHEVLSKSGSAHQIADMSDGKLIIDRGISEGLFRDDLNSDIANRCLAGLFSSAGDPDHYPPASFSKEEIWKHTFLNYMRGISTTKGLARIDEILQNK